ncbi:MAG TPA: hypothetical protein VHT27_13135 [Solirubrobacteraceae bacterium]|jgi:hypothetical protein|nr:hypothetical protein [Solirubrobacteraceae bacterium]
MEIDLAGLREPENVEAIRAGSAALGHAEGLRMQRRIDAHVARKKAIADAKREHDNAVWQDYLEKCGRA